MNEILLLLSMLTVRIILPAAALLVLGSLVQKGNQGGGG